MSRVSYLLELTIRDGQLEAFKEMAAGFVKTVQNEEPGTLTYQWRIGENGERCLLDEAFEDSDALLTHLGNMGPSLPGLFAIAPITRFEVFGPASQGVRTALADFSPHYFRNAVGFDR